MIDIRVKAIFSTPSACVAVKEDGSVVSCETAFMGDGSRNLTGGLILFDTK